MDAGKEDLLRLSGFSAAGSDYELFRNLCIASERLPGHPERRISEYQLQALFGISTGLNPESCAFVWKQTAESLLVFPLKKADAERAKEEIRTPEWSPIPPENANGFVKLPERKAADYEAWKTLQEPLVGNRMRLDIPAGFFAESPNLYLVNRHLSGEAPDENIWICQQARFLCEMCRRDGGELLFRSTNGTEEIPRLLRMLERQVGLPRFYWMWDEK